MPHSEAIYTNVNIRWSEFLSNIQNSDITERISEDPDFGHGTILHPVLICPGPCTCRYFPAEITH